MENKPCNNNDHQWAEVYYALYLVCQHCHWRRDQDGHIEPPAPNDGEVIIVD